MRRIDKTGPSGPGRPLRVLHCPSNVAGHPAMLAKAERERGLKSWSVTLRQSPYQFPSDEVLVDDRGGRRQSRRVARLRLLWRALRDFDVVHFNFGRTILRSRLDLPLLKAAGKVIAVTYQGDDARQTDWCLENWTLSPPLIEALACRDQAMDERNRKAIADFDRYADCIFALNPDLLPVLPERAQFLPYASVDPRIWTPPVPQPDNEVPVVLHAPTNRIAKGTPIVLETIDRLRGDGVPFEFRLVEGLTHEEAKRLYVSADLLIDQLHYGWFGGLSVELMALGKPVVCFVRESDLRLIPAGIGEEMPVINATPDTLYDSLKDCLTRRRHELSDLGRKSRAFVERWFDPLTIAGTTKAAYEAALAGKRR